MILTDIPVFIDYVTEVEVLLDCKELDTEVLDKNTNLMILLIVMLDNLCDNSR